MIPPFPISFCFVACGSAVLHKFQSAAKGKFPFVGFAGVKALDVPALGVVGTAMGRMPVLTNSSLTSSAVAPETGHPKQDRAHPAFEIQLTSSLGLY